MNVKHRFRDCVFTFIAALFATVQVSNNGDVPYTHNEILHNLRKWVNLPIVMQASPTGVPVWDPATLLPAQLPAKAHPYSRSGWSFWFLAVVWSSSGYYSNYRCKPADARPLCSLHPFLPLPISLLLCHSAFPAKKSLKKKKVGLGGVCWIVVKQTGPPPVTLASHFRAPAEVLAVLLLTQLPANMPWKVAKRSPSTWVPIIHGRNKDGVSSSWLWPDPNLAVVATEKWTNTRLPFPFLSAFQING